MARPRRGLFVGLGLLGFLVVVFLVGLFLAPRTRADIELTVDPAMSKGAVEARVTIVEFSDYQ